MGPLANPPELDRFTRQNALQLYVGVNGVRDLGTKRASSLAWGGYGERMSRDGPGRPSLRIINE